MNKSLRASRWLWCASIGLVLALVVVVSVLLVVRNQTSSSPTALETSKPSEVAPSVQPIIESAVAAVDTPPKLPYIDFSPGSVEEACGLNEFPPYHYDDSDHEFDWLIALESAACWSALADHINAMDPYLFLFGEELYRNHPSAFVVLDEPLTFERIFADPVGDLARVQEALSNPECLLTGDETNWELVETCHAEAFLNYALINRFCYDEGGRNRNRTYFWEEDNPTPEQDRFMWKQNLETQWVEEKCEELDPTLELTEHPELYQLLMSISVGRKDSIHVERAHVSLIELSARLGDGAAGVTQPRFGVTGSGPGYREQGYQYGRFSWLLTSAEWREFAWKRQPSTDRFLQTFKMLVMAGARRPNPRDEIEFDWEQIARYLCEPPYNESELYYREDEEIPEVQSCKEIVHELRQRDIKFAALHKTLDKFEQVALELGVYE